MLNQLGLSSGGKANLSQDLFVLSSVNTVKPFHVYHYSKGNLSCMNPYGLNPLKYHWFSPSLMSVFSKILTVFYNVIK